jgi:hypothetical protein
MSELFIPKNPIETAQEFQWEIDRVHPEVAPTIAQHALDILGDVKEIYGTHHLIIHALSGYVLNRKLTIDEQMLEYQFGEIILRGYMGGMPFVQKADSPRLQTFMVDMFDVKILEPRLDEYPSGKISAPVMMPVLDIQSVLAAA